MNAKTNRISKSRMLLFVLVVLAFSGVAQAGNDKGQRIPDIISRQQQIRAEAESQTRGWDNIPLEKRRELIRAQDELMPLIEGKETLADLAPADREEAARKLERIDALALEAENERMVCMRERLTGTHRTQTVCRTIGDMKRWREQAKDFMRQGQQSATATKAASP